MCYNPAASANRHLSHTDGVTVTLMTTETHLNMRAVASYTHPPVCACDVCAPETHPRSTLGFACDKQLRCEVQICHVAVPSACEVSVNAEVETARRHHAAVQADFGKAALSSNYHLHLPASPSSQHLSAAPAPVPAVARSLWKWAAQLNPVFTGDTGTQASRARYRSWGLFFLSVQFLFHVSRKKKTQMNRAHWIWPRTDRTGDIKRVNDQSSWATVCILIIFLHHVF